MGDVSDFEELCRDMADLHSGDEEDITVECKSCEWEGPSFDVEFGACPKCGKHAIHWGYDEDGNEI